MKRLFSVLLAICGWLATLAETQAASPTITWTGLGSDANWGTAANWASTLKSGVSLNFSGAVGTTNTNNVAALTLDTVTVNASSASWHFSGQAVTLSGTLLTSGANTVAWSMDTKLTSTLGAIGITGGDTTLSGVISGNGRLNKTGEGTLILTGSNTYTGGTVIKAGVVQFNHLNAFGSATISMMINGAAIQAGVSGTLANAIASNGVVAGTFMTNGYDVTLTGVVSGGGFKKASGGVLVLTNANNSQSDTTVDEGVLEYDKLGALSTGGLTVCSSGTLRAGTSGTIANNITINDGLASIDTQGFAVGLAGTIVNSGMLLKEGSGTLSIDRDNTSLDGAVSFLIKEGTLRYNDLGALGGGSVGFGGNSTLQAGVAGEVAVAALDVAAGVSGTLDTAGLAVSSTASLTGSGTLVIDGNGSLLLHNAVHSISGGVVVSSGTLQLGDGTGDVSFTDPGLSMVDNAAILYQTYTSGTIGGNLSGTGALMVSGTGVLVLAGRNTFTGSTRVQGAELDVNGSFAGNISIGSGAILGGCGTVNGDVAVNAGGVYGRGGTLTLANVTFDGPSTVAGNVAARTVAIQSGTTATASASDLIVSGTMTVKSGAAYVNSGTTSAPVVEVEQGAVLSNRGTISGTVHVGGLMNAGGTIEGSLIVQSTGELALGGQGSTMVSGSLVVESGAKISLQIGGAQSDRITIGSGSVTLEQGSILSLSLNGSLDGFVVLLDNRGALQISGTFSTILLGDKVLTLSNNTFLYNGMVYQLLYNVDADDDGQKNDVELAVVPEPAVGGLIVGGMGVLFRRLRRCRKMS